ncbi:MAG: PQQ-binding-like beta-propeller repeat protein [Candidatus Cloacimonetes bacterium]|nr:PQQ-binding-like beta-propeller repeat protein [Candidatus Cloacimonadota bacterium]
MINQIYHSTQSDGNFIYKDFFQNENSGVFLMINSFDETKHLMSTFDFILASLLKHNFEDINQNELVSSIKDFFIELNWQLCARMRTLPLEEKGLSLFFLLVRRDTVYFVQFGRFLAGCISDGSLNELGIKWDNFHIKTLDELKLIGYREDDISVKVETIDKGNLKYFFSLPFNIAAELKKEQVSGYGIIDFLKKKQAVKAFPYVLLEFNNKKKYKKRGIFSGKRYLISAIVISALLIFSVYYVFFGENKFEDQLNIQNIKFRETLKNIDMEKLQENLPLDFGLLLVPSKNIQLNVDWESELTFKVTLPPLFDMNKIFLVSNKKIVVYDKKDKKLIWQKDLNQKILALNLLDGNQIIVICEDSTIITLKKDNGEFVWERMTENKIKPLNTQLLPVQVSIEKDRRLSNSLLLFPSEKSIKLLNNLNGEVLSEINFDEKIDFVSEYDIVNKNFYVVSNRQIKAVSFEIINRILEKSE